MLLPIRLYVAYLRLDPVFYGVGLDLLAHGLRPALAFFPGHGERGVEGVGLSVHIVGVDGYRVFPELLVVAGVLGENEDTAFLVDDRGLLGDQVHTVADRVYEQHVEVLVCGDGSGEVVLHEQLDGPPRVRSVALVDLLCRPPHRLHVGGVLGYVGAGGLELGEEGDIAFHLGVTLQHAAVGQEAAHDVLGEVDAVHAEEKLAGQARDVFFLLEHGLRLRELPKLFRIYGNGVGPHPHLAPLVPDGAALDVGLGAQSVGGRLDEGAGVAAGVEGHYVRGEQTLQHALPDVIGQDAPQVRLGPGDVDEKGDEGPIAEPLADEERGHVELVVVEEDGRRVVAFGGLYYGLGEAAIDGDVALLPGPPRLVTQVRRVGEIVESVLDEPEQRVGELVVH